MATYSNTHKESSLATVEFTPRPDGNVSFFHLKKGANSEEAKSLLNALGQEISSETKMDDHIVLITQGQKSQDDVLAGLKAQGNEFKEFEEKKKINLWKWRGGLSLTGHPMQLISAMWAAGGLDIATASFSTLNLVANFINIIFGAEQKPDEYRLNYIKKEINGLLAKELPENAKLPAIDDARAPLRKEVPEPKTSWEKFHGFMRSHSVMFGEIGLRYLGAIALVIPPLKKRIISHQVVENGQIVDQSKTIKTGEHWKTAVSQAKTGAIKDTVRTILNDDKFTRNAGAFWIVGKSFAFLTKVPDPYNPNQKHTLLNTFREKWTFRISSTLEFVAGALIAGDRFKNRKITLPTWKVFPTSMRGLETRDYIGGVGGSLFAIAQVMRITAPFGVRQVKMDEVYAHTTDALSKMPPEKLTQALADTSAWLANHLKDKKVSFSTIYNQLAKNLYHEHHLTLPHYQNSPTPEVSQAAQMEQVAERKLESEAMTKSFATEEFKKASRREERSPADSYREKTSDNNQNLSQAMASLG